MENSKKGLDFIGNCVVFYCHDGKGKFVMGLRSQNSRDERGMWDPGGGSIEHGDTVEETLKREIMEEYGTEVLDFEFLGYRDVHREVDGKNSHWISLDFKVLVNPETVRVCEPHKMDDIGWFDIDNLPENVHSQMGLFVEKYRHKFKENSSLI